MQAFFYASREKCCTLCSRKKSIPFRSHLNCSNVISRHSSSVSGQGNLSFSRRFNQRQNPFLSQYIVLSMFLRRLQNMKRFPLKGSCFKTSCDITDRPFIDLRISVCPGLIKTRKLSGFPGNMIDLQNFFYNL